jgi:threonine/homoserine/homoserine lactone efflux protein
MANAKVTQGEETMDQRAILDHQFTVAAYTVTWVIQLGYLAWLGLKWRAQKREAARLNQLSK